MLVNNQRDNLRQSVFFILIVGLYAARTFRVEAQLLVTFPDTPAGRQFAAWLEAFNTGKRDTIRQFIADHFDKSLRADEIADSHTALFLNDGYFKAQKITSLSPEVITALVKAKRTEYWVEITVDVTTQSPVTIKNFRYRHIEMPADMLPRQKLAEHQISSRLDALVNKLAMADRLSGAILVAKDGKPIYTKATGYASRTCNVPNRIDTKFNIASISKMFTAVAIAQLVQQGKLSYNDEVGKILPDYSNKDVAQKVTLHHLLTHTAGLGSKSLGVFSQRFRNVKDYLPSFVNDPLQSELIGKYNYSNDGYLLLGAVIEKVSGEDYYSYIREHIYKPAGMSHSDSYELDAEPANLATGYMDVANNSRRSNIFDLPVKGLPFGLGYSTVEDLLKFHIALGNHKLLNAKSVDVVWEGKVDTGPDSQYGYGFDIRKYNGTRIIGHGGGWAGVTNQMDMYPDLGYTVIILTNYDDMPRPIAMKLREWLTQGHS